MKERPILFSAPMVRAILDGRKTVTRRAVKMNTPKSRSLHDWCVAGVRVGVCPYGQPGDRLWVRETWGYRGACWTFGEPQKTVWIEYAADGGRANIQRPQGDNSGLPRQRDIRPDEDYVDDYYNGYLNRYWKQNRPSIHMPRWASRITLEVTGVRVERLQDISEADAIAEGLLRDHDGWRGAPDLPWFASPVAAYRSLWESINGAGSWHADPWVWAIEFKRVEAQTA